MRPRSIMLFSCSSVIRAWRRGLPPSNMSSSVSIYIYTAYTVYSKYSEPTTQYLHLVCTNIAFAFVYMLYVYRREIVFFSAPRSLALSLSAFCAHVPPTRKSSFFPFAFLCAVSPAPPRKNIVFTGARDRNVLYESVAVRGQSRSVYYMRKFVHI